jgi:hypothetical protein
MSQAGSLWLSMQLRTARSRSKFIGGFSTNSHSLHSNIHRRAIHRRAQAEKFQQVNMAFAVILSTRHELG